MYISFEKMVTQEVVNALPIGYTMIPDNRVPLPHYLLKKV